VNLVPDLMERPQLVLVTGTVKGGKSSLLNEIAQHHEAPVFYPKYYVENQTQHPEPFLTHDGVKIERGHACDPSMLLHWADGCNPVLIDELQLWWPTDTIFQAIITLLYRLDKSLVIAGINRDAVGSVPWLVQYLRKVARTEIKKFGWCSICGQPARHSQKIGGTTRQATGDLAAQFEPRCERCFDPSEELL